MLYRSSTIPSLTKWIFLFVCFIVITGIILLVHSRSSFQTDPKKSSPSAHVTSPSSTSSTKPLTTLFIPIYIHFLATDIDQASGQPLIRSHGKTEGLAELAQAIETFNAQAAEAAGTDPRRIQLVQMGMRIATSSDPCPDPMSIIEPSRVFGRINILFQTADNCGPMTSPSLYVRSDAEAFSHEMGHALGLKHTFFANNVPGQAEMLARIKNPANPQSCYLLGDNVCDTPPDYGYRFINPDGTVDDSRVVCSIDPYPTCVQIGPPCAKEDALVDTRLRAQNIPICLAIDAQHGQRTYDPTALHLVARTDAAGNLLPNDNNMMGYMDQIHFTHEQFVRMYGFTQWRMDQTDQVPRSEQLQLRGIESGPDDPFGTIGPGVPVDTYWKLNPLMRDVIEK